MTLQNHSTLTAASRQWAERPADERFTSLDDMLAYFRRTRAMSREDVISSRQMRCSPVEGDPAAMAVETAGGRTLLPSNWAFGQLCERAGAPASYLRRLPSALAADCFNVGLARGELADVNLLSVADHGAGPATLAAATGPRYGRVWNEDVLRAVIERFGNGVDGDFRVPGEFGRRVDITKANTTLFAGDRDMFIFLADEQHRIEVPDRRNGRPGSLARGFFLWNSEVGAATLGVGAFLFDYVCCNRIVWGAEGYQEVRIRHTGSAPDRFVSEVAPALLAYANSETLGLTEAIANAQAHRLADPGEFLTARFSTGQARGISLAFETDEQRPIETLWDAVTGITAYARGVEHQDARVSLERRAGALLNQAA